MDKDCSPLKSCGSMSDKPQENLNANGPTPGVQEEPAGLPPIFLELDGSCHCGAARWTFSGELEGGMATACNCTLCRRYGALWAYGWEGKECSISGPVSSYKRVGKADPALEILFCTNCACVLCWRGLRQKEMENNRHRIAVNLRLAEPERISSLPVTRFDGLDTFDDLALDGRCIKDLWF
jgi:hypothetical protein